MEEKKQDNDFNVVVLSGGSVKAFTTIGALQYLVDNNYIKSVNTYIGTSAGAVISYLLAIGYTPIEIMVHITTNNIFDKMTSPDIQSSFSGNGALSFNYIHEILEKMTILKIGQLITLRQLYVDYGKTLILATYNLSKRTLEYISYDTFPDIPCITAIRMSSNLPFIFGNFIYKTNYYIDGGISDNFPICYANKMYPNKKIIGLNLDILEEFKNPNSNTLEYIYNILTIPIEENIKQSIESVKKCENIKIVNLKCSTRKIFNFLITSSEKLDLFSLGYNQCKENFSQPQ